MIFPPRKSIPTFTTAEGGLIYQISLEAFPGFSVYAYVVVVGEYIVLIDCGSGFGVSNQDLEDGLIQVSAEVGRPLGLGDLTHILITHGHIDHYGGLSYVAPRTSALIGIHELDSRILCAHEEHYELAARRLEIYLGEAGVPREDAGRLVEMFNLPKSMYHSTRVDLLFEAAGMRLGPFEFLHVPGHSPGQVVIRLHDVLFTGDHVLEGISPHQAPECLNLNSGLSHYLQSLAAVAEWAGDVRVCLSGHKAPISDLQGRVRAILAEHETRISTVLAYLSSPHTIAEVSKDLFGAVFGYNELLALEEAGAHVEYLYQRGTLRIANLEDVINQPAPNPVFYRRLN